MYVCMHVCARVRGHLFTHEQASTSMETIMLTHVLLCVQTCTYSLRTSSCDCWFHHDRSWWSKISCTRTCVRAVVCGHLLTHEQASTSMETSMLTHMLICIHPCTYSLQNSSCKCLFLHDQSLWSNLSSTRACMCAAVRGHLLTHEQRPTSMQTSMHTHMLLCMCSCAYSLWNGSCNYWSWLLIVSMVLTAGNRRSSYNCSFDL